MQEGTNTMTLLLTNTIYLPLLPTAINDVIAVDSIHSTPPTKQSNEHLSFRSILEQIATKFSTCVVAEGGVRVDSINRDKIRAILDAPSKRAAFNLLCSTFDYETEATRRDSIYLLRKKYTSSDEVPEVTLPEWRSSFSDIHKMYSAFNPDLNALKNTQTDLPLIGLLDFLLEHRKAVGSESDIPLSHVPQGIMPAARQLALCAYLQSSDVDLNEEFRVDNRVSLPESSFVVQSGQPRVFGMEYKQGPQIDKRRTLFIPLSSPEGLSQFSYVSYPSPSSVTAIFEQNQNSTKPLLDKEKHPAKRPETNTLREFAGELNRAPGSKIHFVVDDMLAAKRITTAGCAGQDPYVLFESVAALYGLSVTTRTEPDGSTTAVMQRRPVKVPQDVSDFPSAVLAAVPLPYRRSFHFGAEAQWKIVREKLRADALKTLPGTGTPEAQRSKEIEQYFKTRAIAQRALDNQRYATLGTGLKLRIAAVRQLRSEIEPLLDAPGGPKRVLVSDLSPEAEKALACYLFSGVWFPIRDWVTRPVPPYVTNPDAAFLIGGVYQDEGQERYRLGFRYFDPVSGTRETVMLGNLRRQ